MKNGFYTALGTPFDEQGNVHQQSLKKHMDTQIQAGASGLLCMGSMGNMVSIQDKEYVKTAKICSQHNKERVPLMVGVMDCSIGRILDRIEALKGLTIQGVVATLPFYYKISTDLIVDFYRSLAQKSHFPIYLYDLASVTQTSMTTECVEKLMSQNNIKGIKSGNLNLVSYLQREGIQEDFDVFYSGLDTFDVAWTYGINKHLDGMFGCMPNNTQKMYTSKQPQKHLQRIIKMRDLFVKHGVFRSFSYAMECIGCPGIYHPDYDHQVSEQGKQEIYEYMKKWGEMA